MEGEEAFMGQESNIQLLAEAEDFQDGHGGVRLAKRKIFYIIAPWAAPGNNLMLHWFGLRGGRNNVREFHTSENMYIWRK